MLCGFKNINVKKYLKILKCKEKSNKIAIEGSRLVLEAIKQKIHLECLFLTQKCIVKNKDTKYDLTKFNIKIYIITEKAAKIMSEVNTPQGVFAIAEKNLNLNITDIKKGENILALYKIKDPSNLGVLFRSAFCFGFLKIVLYDCCNIYNSKVIRCSMGSVFGLCFFVCESFNNFLRYLNFKNIYSYATVVNSLAKPSKNTLSKKGVIIYKDQRK